MGKILQTIAAINPFRKSTESIEGEILALRAALNEKKDRRQYLLTAPRAREEQIQMACGLIDAMGAGYEERLKASSAHDLINPAKENINPSTWAGPLLARREHMSPSPELLQQNLCALLGPLFKEAMREHIERMDIVCGPPAAEREAELIRLSAEITELEQDIEELRSLAISRLESIRNV